MQGEIIARNQAGESIRAISNDLWQHLGYADEYVCASKISQFLRLRGVTVAATRSGPKAGVHPGARFTEERLAEVRGALKSGESIWAFADKHWQTWGFPNRSACDSLLRKWLRTKVAA